MPLRKVRMGGKTGWRWGRKGKFYPGKKGRARALRQARAIRASGWVENAFDPNQPRVPSGSSNGGRWVAIPPHLNTLAIMEKYKNDQAWDGPMKEFMESHGLALEDYKTANELLWRHNVSSDRMTDQALVDSWNSNTPTGQALRALSQWNEWQEQNVRVVPDLNYDGIRKMVLDDRLNWKDLQLGKYASSKEDYLRLLDLEKSGEPLYFRKGPVDRSVISMTKDPRGATSGSSQFTPDRVHSFSDMKSMGYYLVSGSRGLVGVVSAQEREYIWINPSIPNVANVFCPTGEGGGVDPTCSPSGKELGHVDDVDDQFHDKVLLPLHNRGNVSPLLMPRIVSNATGRPTKLRTPGSYDPTRTVTLRRQFEGEFSRRFARLKREVDRLVVEEDAFGLTVNVFCPTGEGGGIDPTCSPGGGFYPRRSGAVIKARTEVLSTGLKDNRERMILIEGDTVVGDTIGSEGSVTPLQDELELLKDPGKKLILIHNHPHGNSFSDGDLKSLSIWPGIESMEVVTHDGSVFFMKRGSKFPSSLSKLSDLWEKSYDYSRYSWNDAKEAGSGEFRHRVLDHIIMTGLSQRGVIEYGAILSPEAEGIVRKFKKSFDLAVKGVKTGTVVRNTVNYDPDQPREPAGSSKGGQWISKSDIESAGKEYGWDVCQIGVCLADRFSRDEEEYQKIWSTAQDLFGVDDMMGDDYLLKPSSRKEYTDRLYGSLSSGRYMDTTVNSFNPNQPREPAGSSKGGRWKNLGIRIPGYVDAFGEKPDDNHHAKFRYESYLERRRAVESYLEGIVPDAQYTHGEYTVVVIGNKYLTLRSGDPLPAPGGTWMGFWDPDLKEILNLSEQDYSKLNYYGKMEADAKVQAIKYAPIQFESEKRKFWKIDRLTSNTRWRFLTSVDKLRQFRDWLARQVQYIIFGSTTAQIEESWWRQFVERGYRQGQERTFIDVRKAPATSDPKLLEQYAGGRAEFLRGVFGQPTAVEKVQLLAGRIYSDLRGVTEQMGASMGRELADGIARGDHPHEIARRMAKNIDGIGRDRAKLIARTEIIRAHAEGQLDAMKRTGVTHVGVAVEWSTADDEHVCPLCRPLDGVVLAVEEAHGLIPRHPNCRCAFVPANVGEDKSGQIRGQRKILRAFSRSVSAERPKRKQRSLREQIKRSRWTGAGRRVKKSRPVSILD